jgi:hypothetical protein
MSIMKPLSERLSDLSDRAKKTEDVVAAPREVRVKDVVR